MARHTRKPDWYRMSAAVLKNRLLLLTDRQFDEADYGASTFNAFLKTGTGFVSLDPSTHPPTVLLIDRPT